MSEIPTFRLARDTGPGWSVWSVTYTEPDGVVVMYQFSGYQSAAEALRELCEILAQGAPEC